MSNENHVVNSKRHTVIFLGTSNDSMATRQDVGCKISETFKLPLAKVLAAMMRTPFPVSRDLTLKAANALVQTLHKLGVNAVTDSEGEWPPEARVLLNLQPSLPKKTQPSNTVGQSPFVPAQTGKSVPAGKPTLVTDQVEVTKSFAGDGSVAPSIQILRKLGASTVADLESAGPSGGKMPVELKPPLPEKKQPSSADEQSPSLPARTEKNVSASKPTLATDPVRVTKPLIGDQNVTASVETEPDEPISDGLTDIEDVTARSSDKAATVVPRPPPTQLGRDLDLPLPEEFFEVDRKKPRRWMKYLAMAASILLLLAIVELAVSHSEWLPFGFGRDKGLQAQFTESSTLEKQLYRQAQALEEFGSNSQMILTAWQDYVETCPDGQYADRAQQQLAYWQDYRSVESATPPATEALVLRAVRRELKPYVKTKAMIPIPDLDDPEPLWESSSAPKFAAMENLPDYVIDMPLNSPLPNSPVRVGPGVTAPKVIHRVEPVYPKLARQVKAQGEVVLQVTILRDGSVGDVQVLQSPNRKLGCDKAAVEALKQWKFQPGKMNGHPVEVIIELKIHFVL